MPDPRKAVAYARQSLARDEADSLSIEFQLSACREHVARSGWILVGEYTDPDTKGWKRHRPGFDAMLGQIASGNADCVVIYKLSRFARNLIMQEDVVSLIGDAGGDLVSVTEPHVSTSPMVRQILGAVNEQYRRDQGDWLRSTWAARARRGLHHGYAPYGYRLDAGTLVLDDATAPLARDIWQWALSGHGTPEICYRLNERGIPTNRGKAWSQNGVLRLLRNPVYAGHVVHRGEVVARDAHPAIVTDAEWSQAQTMIDRRSHHRRKAAPSWAEGFVWHQCGRRMYLAGWSQDGVTRTRFRCAGIWSPGSNRGETCTHRPASVFAEKVEAAIVREVAALGDRLLSPDQVAAQMAHLAGASARQRDRQRATLTKRLDDLDRQRQRLLDLVLSERIDADLYRERDDSLKAEIATATVERDAVPEVVTRDTIAATHDRLVSLTVAAHAVARHDPAALVELLTVLDARLVIGDVMRLTVGERFAAYVR